MLNIYQIRFKKRRPVMTEAQKKELHEARRKAPIKCSNYTCSMRSECKRAESISYVRAYYQQASERFCQFILRDKSQQLNIFAQRNA